MPLTERFDEALLYATRLHGHQVRKGSETPYVAHLLATASLALENGATEDEAIAALLHDAAEDQGGEATLATIRERFGDAVADIVAGCSDTFASPKPPWKERKLKTLAHIPRATPSVRLVSSCDKLHNVRALLADYRLHGDALWQRFTGGREGTLWYYRAMADAFRQAGDTPLAEELTRGVRELEALAGAGETAR